MTSSLYFDRSTIDQMEQRYRAQFINSLAGFKSANLVGTVDRDGHTNLAIVNSVIHLGANPPLMGMVTRPRTVERHSVENILATGYYTLNQVHGGMIRPAHQTSARYARGQSEFDATGLTPGFREGHPAPYVEESRLKIGLKLLECKHLAFNNTDFIVGEIVAVHVEPNVIQPDGYVDIEALDAVTISGLDSYHRTERLERLAYAKPDQPPRALDD
ncbi:flavin reductase [Marinimicrobium sp. C6131]|uniref:flavin reductase family protein n=1 Tax=Marinimicrobium sp. C6131 TaxID=3022676 RepID=UPI00223E653F|nr:flavin reductase [Marinimicrobium sp. C6131]UZJ44067.1 flavin reductase [Marinimicrobium sp. C6131]